MQRHSMNIQNHRYWLSRGANVDHLKKAATDAVRQGGGVVDVVLVGNRTVSALISLGLPVVFESEDIDFDERDTGDVGLPFDDLTYGALDYP